MELTLGLIKAIAALEHERQNEPADYEISLDGEQEWPWSTIIDGVIAWIVNIARNWTITEARYTHAAIT